MIRVVDRYTVAHLWANGIQEEARTANGSLYFEGDSIFSYGHHFMIARHVKNTLGESAVLFTRRTYSRTTAAQIGIVRNAASQKRALFVPDPAEDAEGLFDRWFSRIKEIAACLNKAKKPGKYILQIASVFEEAAAYAGFFGLQLPEHLVKAGGIQDQQQYADLLKAGKKWKAAQEKKRQAARVAQQKTALKDWRSFKRRMISTADGFDYLRYNSETGRVETTQAVEIPAGAAREFYALILETLEKGGCTDCRLMLMNRYAVTAVNVDFIVVGCHKIALKEIKSFTKKLGW
ncbi:hypothetical protein [Mucilaginibacter kameinonensis]|uniref:hypothetical protein n=1 Tax=Mucilaginibacter kameinonensis TaxID=452286 RepID=UPI000EF81EE7|nr:hypothetical protein [Mucilaginibacter kameinonensis]